MSVQVHFCSHAAMFCKLSFLVFSAIFLIELTSYEKLGKYGRLLITTILIQRLLFSVLFMFIANQLNTWALKQGATPLPFSFFFISIICIQNKTQVIAFIVIGRIKLEGVVFTFHSKRTRIVLICWSFVSFRRYMWFIFGISLFCDLVRNVA